MKDNFENRDNPETSINIGGDYVGGDKAGRDMHKNISNSTISRLEREHGPEVNQALKQVCRNYRKVERSCC